MTQLLFVPKNHVRARSPFQDACDCANCGLRKDGQDFRPVPGSGNPDAHILVVGEAPGATEVSLERPFIGESGKLLDRALEQVGLSRSDIYCTNSVLCRPPENATPTAREISACNQRLKQEILSLPNRHIIIVMGTSAVQAVTGKKSTITDNLFRVEWSPAYNCFLMFSYHTAACLRDPDKYVDVLFTLTRAREFLDVKKGPLPSPTIEYTLEDSVHEALRALAKLRTLPCDAISCDIETTGPDKPAWKDWRRGTLSQLGFGFLWEGREYAYLIPYAIAQNRSVKQALADLFARRDVKWIWHNGKFDVQFLKTARNGNLGIQTPHIDIDTLFLDKSIDERPGIHGLGSIVARYYRDFDYKKAKDADLGFDTPMYHGKDCIYTHRLGVRTLPDALACETPSRQGYPNPQYRHDTVLVPVWNAIVDIEMDGVLIDQDAALALAKEMGNYPNDELGGTLRVQQDECQRVSGYARPVERKVKHITTLPQEYYKVGPRKGQPKPLKTRTAYKTITEYEGLNLNSPVQIGDLLYKKWHLPVLLSTAKGQPSVDEETLVQLKRIASGTQQEFLEKLLAYREQFKLYSTYVKGAIKQSAETGCVHSHFGFDPVTGRPSAKSPNIQNIPKESPIKKLYIARPGYYFLEADYSQQEMRVAAKLARDRALLRACMQGDFHTEVAKMVFYAQYGEIERCGDKLSALEHLLTIHKGYSHIRSLHAREHFSAATLRAKLMDHWRKAAKGINFGALYGQTPHGLKEYLQVKNQIDVTLEETTAYHASWFSEFADLSVWLEARCNEIHDYGFVDTPTGHRRRKPLITERTQKEAENQAMNSPVQSLASDMTMLAIISLHEKLQRLKLGRILFFVHDSIAFEIIKERLAEGAALIKYEMEHALDLIQDNDFYVPFPVELKYGRGWGELQALDIA